MLRHCLRSFFSFRRFSSVASCVRVEGKENVAFPCDSKLSKTTVTEREKKCIEVFGWKLAASAANALIDASNAFVFAIVKTLSGRGAPPLAVFLCNHNAIENAKPTFSQKVPSPLFHSFSQILFLIFLDKSIIRNKGGKGTRRRSKSTHR